VLSNEGEISEESYQGGGLQIGWIDGEDVYLLPMAAYKAARAIGAATGDDITTLEPTLRKFLHQDGLLASTDIATARNTITVRRRFQRLRYDVLHFKKATLFPDDEDMPHTPPDPPDPLDPGRVPPAPQAASVLAQKGSSPAAGSSTFLDPGKTSVDPNLVEAALQANGSDKSHEPQRPRGPSKESTHDLTQAHVSDPVLAQSAPQAISGVCQVMIEEESERLDPHVTRPEEVVDPLDPAQKVADQAAQPSIEQTILDYGKATGYAPIVVGDTSIGMGSSAWYRFVWMAGPTKEQRQAVYDFIIQRSPSGDIVIEGSR
jgi:hypothetical protein